MVRRTHHVASRHVASPHVASPRPNPLSPPWRPNQPPRPLLRAASLFTAAVSIVSLYACLLLTPSLILVRQKPPSLTRSLMPTSRPPNGMRGGEREGEGEEEFAEMGEGDEELVEIDSGAWLTKRGQSSLSSLSSHAVPLPFHPPVPPTPVPLPPSSFAPCPHFPSAPSPHHRHGCPVRASDEDVLSADFDDDDAPAELADDGMDSVYAVACSPLPGGRVASGGGDDVAYLWTIGQAEDPVKLEGHRDSIAAVEFSGDGRWVATAGMDGVVMLWDADTGYRRHRLEGPGEAIEVRMAATARHGPRPRPRLPLPCSPQRCLVIALVAVPAVGGRSSLTFLSTHILPFPDVASTGSGGTGGVGGSNSVDVECGDGGVHGRLHRAQRRGHLWGLLARWYAILLPLLFMPALWCGRGRAVWTGSTDGSVRCWDPRSAATTATLQGPLFHSDAITCLAMAPQGAVGAAGSSDHTTALFGLHQPKVGQLPCPPSPAASCLALLSLSPRSHTHLPLLLSHSSLLHRHSLSYKLGTGHIFSFLSSHSSLLIPLFSFLSSHSSLLIPLFSFLSSHSSLLIPLFSFLSSHSSLLIPLFSFLSSHSSLLMPLFSHQSSATWLGAWHVGGACMAWHGWAGVREAGGAHGLGGGGGLQPPVSVRALHHVHVPTAHHALPGPTVATASLDGSVRIFDINSLQLRSTCTHQDEVVQMAWAPAAPLLVTATADGAVHVWDARTGAIQRTLRGNRDAVVSLALTPDAAFAVTGSDDHTARVFQL
ncbi:unnamed protein product [Closterium sp. NIES-64]|nr:unnamed protein product [Closterium sp. NIES-64]